MLMQISGNFFAVAAPLFAFLACMSLLVVIWAFWVISRRKGRTEAKEQPNQMGDDDPWGSGILGRVKNFFMEESNPAESKVPTLATPAPSFTASAPEAPRSDGEAVEVFRVMRDLADGSLLVEVDGVRYRKLAEINDPQVGRRFMSNARALAQFALILKGSPPPAAPLLDAVPPQLAELFREEQPAPPQLPPDGTPLPPLRPRATAPTGPTTPPEPVRMRPLDALKQQDKSSEEGEDQIEAGLINLADEIEEMLQFRLSLNTHLAQRSIHIRPGLGGGIRVEVDGTFYDEVGDVSDGEVREFIQATIREWEARS